MPQVDYSQAGAAAQPSPSIWKDCPYEDLNQEGWGFYMHEDFVAGNEIFTDASILGSVGLTIDGDASSTIAHRTGGTGGLQDLAVSGTDNNAIAAYTQPLGKMVRNSGNKIWFEARYRPLSITEDRGVLFGLVAEGGLSRDVLADDVASVAAGLIGQDMLVFTTQTDNKDDLQAVLRKSSGTPTVLKADVTQATALPSPAALVAANYYKLGFKFDGNDGVSIYVNGIKVASTVLTSAQFPTADLAMILAVKTGAAATATINFDWVRVAVQNRR